VRCPKQTATLYREGHGFQPKVYTFRLQQARAAPQGGGDKQHTIAKAKIDLAPYCSPHCSAGGGGSTTRDVLVRLAPFGTLKMGVRTTWLQHARPDEDAVTEISQLSIDHSAASSANALDEQDLQGFDADVRCAALRAGSFAEDKPAFS
jgi:hypothetical protein